MRSTKTATWRYLTAVLLLATMPAQASLAPLPPRSQEPAGLVADEVLEELRVPRSEELGRLAALLLVAEVLPENPICEAEPAPGKAPLGPKSRVWGFELIRQGQVQWNQRFNPEIVVGVVVQAYAYTLGAAGNRTRFDEADGTSRVYGYDDLYRLTSETISDAVGDPVYAKAFNYDPVGNRLSQEHVEGATTTTAYAYDDRDRLTAEGTQAFDWDASGRLISKDGEASYTWDVEDRLIRVDLADGTVVENVYDADGVRVRTTTTPSGGAAEVVDYLNDTTGLSQVVAETDGAGELAAYYLRGDDVLAVMRPEAGGAWSTRSYHADGLGSIRALTDEAGGVTDRWAFSAFGELLSHEGDDPSAYLFAGEQVDPNIGWSYNRARWMDPSVGRFASVDPLTSTGTVPSRFHLYVYANSDPVLLTDPSGWVSVVSISVSLSIQSTITTTGTAHPARFRSRPPHVRKIIKQPEFLAATTQAWMETESQNPSTRHEEGGWVYMNPETKRFTVRRTTLKRALSINLSRPPDVPGFFVVGNFHTHPGGDGHSARDSWLENWRGVPGVIVMGYGSFDTYGPKRRHSWFGPRGYPGAASDALELLCSSALNPFSEEYCYGGPSGNP